MKVLAVIALFALALVFLLAPVHFPSPVGGGGGAGPGIGRSWLPCISPGAAEQQTRQGETINVGAFRQRPKHSGSGIISDVRSGAFLRSRRVVFAMG